VDIFSFSIILWELGTGASPWPEIKFGWEFSERYGRGERPNIPFDCPFVAIIRKCWHQDPYQRPSFTQVFSDLQLFQTNQRSKSATMPPVPNVPHYQVASQIRSISTPIVPIKPTNGFSILSGQPVKVLPVPIVDRTTSMDRTTPMDRSTPPDRTIRSVPTPSSIKPTKYGMIPSGSSVNVSSEGEPPQATPQNDVEIAITRVFESRTVEAWTIFSNALVTNLNTTSALVDQLRYIFDTQQGGVEKTIWLLFLLWFTPLSTSEYGSADGYDIDTIVEICSPSYFHGFMDSKQSQKLLKGKVEGTFLLRFSTHQPGFYTLSVAYSGTVGHWRIASEKKFGQAPVFRIDTRVYKSLDDIISTHRGGRDPLKIKLPKSGQPDYCFLTTPYSRPEGNSETYYQVA